MLNIFQHKRGLRIIPESVSSIDRLGELEVSAVVNKLLFHNGIDASNVVTENHTSSLINKTLLAVSNHIISSVNRAAQFNVSSGDLEASSVTNTELGFVSGVTSAIQTQINSKQTSGNYITALTGDVSATGPGSVAAVVNTVGGSSAANIHAAELLANAATSFNTVSTIVRRNSSGGFIAGDVTLGNITATSINSPGSNTIGTMSMSVNTIKSDINSGLSLQTQNNQGIALQPNGTGTVIVTSSLEVDKFIQVSRLDDGVTTGTGATLNVVTQSFIKVTNGSLVSLSAIPAGQNGQELVIKNGTGASFTINNEDSGVTAANRILTGTNSTLTLNNNAAMSLIYDSGASRWQVYGGSGGGTPTIFGSRGSPRTIVAGTGITSGASHMSTTASSQIIFVSGNIGHTLITASPAIDAGTIVGQTMILVGGSDASPLEIPNQGSHVELNGNAILGFGNSLSLLFDGSVWTEISRS